MPGQFEKSNNKDDNDDDVDLKNSTNAVDSDLDEDEVHQDWSQVAKLTKKALKAKLPKRGEKEYEPDGTEIQDAMLVNARKAMYDTLFNSIRGSMLKNQVKAFYIPDRHVAIIPHPKGNFLQTIGRVDKTGICYLNFLEFLYLAERGTVTPFLCNDLNDITNGNEYQLSIQEIYSFFKSQNEMDNFQVYAHLKRLGFIVFPSNSFESGKTTFYPPTSIFKKYFAPSLFKSFYLRIGLIFSKYFNSIANDIFYSTSNFHYMKYLNSISIYKSLNKLIPYHKVPKSKLELLDQKFTIDQLTTTNREFELSFDVWKPQVNFKKKCPNLPDFQIVVYNKNDGSQHFPTYHDCQSIFNQLDYKFGFVQGKDDFDWDSHSYTDEKLRAEYLSSLKSKAKQSNASINTKVEGKKKKRKINSFPPHVQQKMRLKNGYRSFLLAVIDDGIISFTRMTESDFGSENVWYNPTNSKTKRPTRKK
ncbi:hypothetical protein Kpol_1048p52 [Vanderwaltozyma polyspora DSM 70294]|uniref:tRNA-splicing endonuclease subunit Sen54 N-terminal domain-containing protein n=1 Tax=Vanderwaltozyma polyspora (strain ATCC 22028 / DSM 70294 / BCRC 21397 / CBS 2163 / NBRC 10782 / NRRL Y-8283 / UCD 57-17) TaxID=436907 RepID=A7TGL4_VANPO|nr:uncharacterized protein Kpol_1048p52 [Vanderwaltozyma polyspora DSM 70294]EDO18621.1 hypothetical protein Kpol_1048p52 [Vanderwaltozyma polyspora DSM 70294]